MFEETNNKNICIRNAQFFAFAHTRTHTVRDVRIIEEFKSENIKFVALKAFILI